MEARTMSLQSMRLADGAYKMINSSRPPIAVGMPPLNFASFKCLHTPAKTLKTLRDDNCSARNHHAEDSELEHLLLLDCKECYKSSIWRCSQIYDRLGLAADNTLPPRTTRIRILIQTPVVQGSGSSLPCA